MYLLWTSLVAQMVKNPPAMQEPWLNSWDWKIPWRRDRLPTPVFLGFPRGLPGKESACNVGDLGSIPELGRSPGGGHDNTLQYSCLENPHGPRSLVGLLALEPRLNIMVHRPSCSLACGIFPYQGSKMCSLHWHKNSHPLYLQVSPISDSWPENMVYCYG